MTYKGYETRVLRKPFVYYFSPYKAKNNTL